jgi:hypothetical protein
MSAWKASTNAPPTARILKRRRACGKARLGPSRRRERILSAPEKNSSSKLFLSRLRQDKGRCALSLELDRRTQGAEGSRDDKTQRGAGKTPPDRIAFFRHNRAGANYTKR